MATALLGGALGIVVARLLGPSDTGAFSVALSGLVVLSLLATLGVHAGANYFVSSGRWHAGDALRQSQIGALTFGLVTAIIAAAGLVLGGGLDGVSAAATVLLVVAVPFAAAWTCTSFVALATDRYETFAAASVVANLMALVLVVSLTPSFGLSGAIAGLAAAHLVNAALLFWWERTRQPSPRPGWLSRTPAELRRAVGFGVKAYVTHLFTLLNSRADLFILGAVVGGAEVGQYAVAIAVTELGLMLPRALNAVVFPRVASLDAGADEAQRRMVISKSVRHTLLQTPLTLAVLVVGLLAVPLVYGDAFGPALEPGLILLPGVAALGLSNVLSATVSGRGYPQYAMYTWIAVTPIAIALYWLLIPGLGSEGAALGSTLVYTLNLILIAYCFRRTAGFTGVRELLPGAEELGEYRALTARLLARLRRPRGA